MSKWQESFDKKRSSRCEDSNCISNYNEGLFIPNRQLSILVALLLFLLLSSFIVGYFFGKKSAIENFSHQASVDIFADQMRTSTLLMTDNGGELPSLSNTMDIVNTTQETQNNISPTIIAADNSTHDVVVHNNEEQKTQYYAQLIGFGTEKAAYKFMQKLALKNIETIVKKHVSKTSKGRVSHWYQVV